VTALALDGTSPLDLGAVTEVFGIDRGLAPRWYGTIFVRYPGRTEVARPEDIRALLERHVPATRFPLKTTIRTSPANAGHGLAGDRADFNRD